MDSLLNLIECMFGDKISAKLWVHQEQKMGLQTNMRAILEIGDSKMSREIDDDFVLNVRSSEY